MTEKKEVKCEKIGPITWKIKYPYSNSKSELVFSIFKKDIHIHFVNTEAEWRNRGFATRLIEVVKVLSRIEKKPVTVTTAYTDFHYRFWKKRGFEIVNYVEKTDLVLMECTPYI